MRDEDIQIMSHCHLLKQLSDDEIKIALELMHPTVAEFPAKSIIFHETEFSPSLIFILSGILTVERKEAGKRVLLNRLETGDCFGMASMFGNEEIFPTRVTSKTSVRIAAVDEAGLTALFLAIPSTALAHVRYLSEKIRFLNKKISALVGRGAESKVSNYILKTYGKHTSHEKLNMAEISRKLDIGRASLYRIMRQLNDTDVILYQNGFIEIKNLKELERLSK